MSDPPIHKIRAGAQFTIYAWVRVGTCDTREFLEELERNIPNEHKRIMAVIEFTAAYGPPKNQLKCRKLQGDNAEGLFEFKSPGGARIIWFYDRNRMIICSHGFVKMTLHQVK
jgi:hypothetical protein